MAFVGAPVGGYGTRLYRNPRAGVSVWRGFRSGWVGADVGVDVLPSRVRRSSDHVVVARAKLEAPMEVITSGPVFRRGDLGKKSAPPIDWNLWKELASQLEEDLGKEATVERIHLYYLPLFFWLKREIIAKKAAGQTKTIVVGLTCPQGGGKTTITRFLTKLFALEGLTCASASTDDFYLTHAEQVELAKKHEGNHLLEYRGNPGSMDVDLAYKTLHQVCDAKKGDKVAIPRYDKSAFGGRGDRFGRQHWHEVEGPVDVLILEGWCLGFQPVEKPMNEALSEVNEYLKDFSRIYDVLDMLLVVEVADLSSIYRWRKEAEDAMKRRGKAGMSDEQLRDFIGRFMPSYDQYLEKLYNEGVYPGLPQLNIKIDQNRVPIE